MVLYPITEEIFNNLVQDLEELLPPYLNIEFTYDPALGNLTIKEYVSKIVASSHGLIFQD